MSAINQVHGHGQKQGGNRQVHLVAHFPGVNSQTVWSDPQSGSQIDFESFRRFAQTAERGFFDYVFLAEGLRMREHGGEIHDLDVAGRPATLPILAAMASVTEHIGVVGTLSSTFNEPYELARQLATIDQLSGGRVGWNVVTSSDAFHGGNFRRGGYLPYAERYERATEFVEVAKKLWASWQPGAVTANAERGNFIDPSLVHSVTHAGKHFDITATSTVPRSPQGYPVIVQAGDSPAGRDFASRHAEIIFSRHSEFAEGQRFYSDVKGRLPAVGRDENGLLILPAATFVLGDTDAEARDRARDIAFQQISEPTALAWIEAVWGQDLPGLDPNGPLPEIDPGDGILREGQHNPQLIDRISNARRLRERPTTPLWAPPNLLRMRSTGTCRGEPLMVSCSCRTSRRAGSMSLSTAWCQCCKNAACSALNILDSRHLLSGQLGLQRCVRPCVKLSACPLRRPCHTMLLQLKMRLPQVSLIPRPKYRWRHEPQS